MTDPEVGMLQALKLEIPTTALLVQAGDAGIPEAASGLFAATMAQASCDPAAAAAVQAPETGLQPTAPPATLPIPPAALPPTLPSAPGTQARNGAAVEPQAGLAAESPAEPTVSLAAPAAAESGETPAEATSASPAAGTRKADDEAAPAGSLPAMDPQLAVFLSLAAALPTPQIIPQSVPQANPTQAASMGTPSTQINVPPVPAASQALTAPALPDPGPVAERPSPQAAALPEAAEAAVDQSFLEPAPTGSALPVPSRTGDQASQAPTAQATPAPAPLLQDLPSLAPTALPARAAVLSDPLPGLARGADESSQRTASEAELPALPSNPKPAPGSSAPSARSAEAAPPPASWPTGAVQSRADTSRIEERPTLRPDPGPAGTPLPTGDGTSQAALIHAMSTTQSRQDQASAALAAVLRPATPARPESEAAPFPAAPAPLSLNPPETRTEASPSGEGVSRPQAPVQAQAAPTDAAMQIVSAVTSAEASPTPEVARNPEGQLLPQDAPPVHAGQSANQATGSSRAEGPTPAASSFPARVDASPTHAVAVPESADMKTPPLLAKEAATGTIPAREASRTPEGQPLPQGISQAQANPGASQTPQNSGVEGAAPAASPFPARTDPGPTNAAAVPESAGMKALQALANEAATESGPARDGTQELKGQSLSREVATRPLDPDLGTPAGAPRPSAQAPAPKPAAAALPTQPLPSESGDVRAQVPVKESGAQLAALEESAQTRRTRLLERAQGQREQVSSAEVPALAAGQEAKAAASVPRADPAAARPSPMLAQVEGTIRWVLQNKAPGAELQLHPDSLGRVTIQLRVEGQEVHARLWVSEASSLPVLQEHKAFLETSLKEQGLSLGSFSLQAGTQQQQNQTAFQDRAMGSPSGRVLPSLAKQEIPSAASHDLRTDPLDPHQIEVYA